MLMAPLFYEAAHSHRTCMKFKLSSLYVKNLMFTFWVSFVFYSIWLMDAVAVEVEDFLKVVLSNKYKGELIVNPER